MWNCRGHDESAEEMSLKKRAIFLIEITSDLILVSWGGSASQIPANARFSFPDRWVIFWRCPDWGWVVKTRRKSEEYLMEVMGLGGD